MRPTITLTPNFIKLRIHKKEVKFKITNGEAIELLIKWKIPMNTFCFLDDLDNDDQEWIKENCKRVLSERNSTNNLLLKEFDLLTKKKD